MNGWENVGIIHTVPLEDLHDHSLSPQCACQPRAEIVEESNVLQVVHNAFDGRDFDERDDAKRKEIRELNRDKA